MSTRVGRIEPLDSEAPAPRDRPSLMESVDDSLHFGRAWHRFGYCYRNGEALRILDAGCGTGRSAIEAATLNPAASIRAVDVSSAVVDLAQPRSEAIVPDRLEFSVHDLGSPLPESWG